MNGQSRRAWAPTPFMARTAAIPAAGDRWVIIAIANDVEWDGQVLGNPAWAATHASDAPVGIDSRMCGRADRGLDTVAPLRGTIMAQLQQAGIAAAWSCASRIYL